MEVVVTTRYKTCKASVKMSPSTNFYRSGALPVAQPTVSKHSRDCKMENVNVNLYSASSQKITPLMRSMCWVLFKKKCLQCTTKTVNLHVRLTQIVLEQVPCRWSSDSEGVTTVHIELKVWNLAAGGTKMLSFSNLSDRCTQLRQIIRCLATQALVHRHPKLVCDSICHIEPM